MVAFIIGLFCGVMIGAFIMCLVVAAKDRDNIGGDDDDFN